MAVHPTKKWEIKMASCRFGGIGYVTLPSVLDHKMGDHTYPLDREGPGTKPSRHQRAFPLQDLNWAANSILFTTGFKGGIASYSPTILSIELARSRFSLVAALSSEILI